MSQGNSLPDKDYLYGNWQERKNRRVDWLDKFGKSLAYKSQDMAEDEDLQITNANQTRNGITWKELAVIAATLLGGGYLYQNSGNLSPTATIAPTDSEYEVRFFDADGKPINVPHINTKPK